MFESTRRVHTTTKNVKKKAKDNRCMLECQRCEYGDGDKENEYTLPLLNKNFYFFLFQRYVGLLEYILNVECSISIMDAQPYLFYLD